MHEYCIESKSYVQRLEFLVFLNYSLIERGYKDSNGGFNGDMGGLLYGFNSNI